MSHDLNSSISFTGSGKEFDWDQFNKSHKDNI